MYLVLRFLDLKYHYGCANIYLLRFTMSSITSSAQHKKSPLLVVVMGVSGTGKSTLAAEIASYFDITFLDADSLHSAIAINKMSQGIPLTDTQRAPWIQSVCSQLRQYESQNKSSVLAYSGLKQQHRQLIFGTYPNAVGILLNADQTLIVQRLHARGGHFMPPQLLSSQIADMEHFDEETALLKLNSAEKIEHLLLQSVTFINTHLNPLLPLSEGKV